MAVKTFTTGEVLTAADTNTYLNNGGLVYLAAASFTTASPVNIDSVFSSSYDIYRLFWYESDSATGGETRVQFRTAGATNGNSNYVHQNTYFTTTANLVRNTVATTSSLVTQNVGATGWTWEMVIYNPFLNTRNTVFTVTGNVETGSVPMFGGGCFNTTTSFDGISISRTSGTMSGKYYVYGLRQP